MRTKLFAVLAACAVAPIAAQPLDPFAPPLASTAVPAGAAAWNAGLGRPLSATAGPWVLGEVLFFSGGRVLSAYQWQEKLRGIRGQIYTASDLQSDVRTLMDLKAFDRVAPGVYAIANAPVPAQFASLSISTDQVRVVFDVDVKASSGPPKPRLVTPPSAVSGLILTPTAYRGAGKFNTPGLGLDFNAAYIIGRLYGKNSYPFAPRHTDYIDRLGLWTLAADGKMQLQSDGPWRPAVAVGGQAMAVFRDSPQPTVATPAVSVKVNAKSTQILTDAYLVASKNVKGVRASAGLMQGNIGNLAASLSEYLTPEALRFYNNKPLGTIISSPSVPFASAFYMLRPDYPVGFEIMKFNGSPANPWLINFKLGRFLHLNFDISLLKFEGGYELLGLFQFRYNQFPNK